MASVWSVNQGMRFSISRSARMCSVILGKYNVGLFVFYSYSEFMARNIRVGTTKVG